MLSVMLLVSELLELVLLESVLLVPVSELLVVLVLLLLLLLLLLVGPLFVFEEGIRMDFFPFFRGPPPLSGHLSPALLVI